MNAIYLMNSYSYSSDEDDAAQSTCQNKNISVYNLLYFLAAFNVTLIGINSYSMFRYYKSFTYSLLAHLFFIHLMLLGRIVTVLANVHLVDTPENILISNDEKSVSFIVD